MQAFRDGKIKCLIATNVCARGLDIPEIGKIFKLINFKFNIFLNHIIIFKI